MIQLPSFASVYAGIDPGTSGCVAVIPWNLSNARLYPMPARTVDRNRKERKYADPAGYLSLLRMLSDLPCTAIYCEDVWPSPGQAVTVADQMSYGRGVLHTAAEVVGVGIEYVSPQVWKRRFGIHGVARRPQKEMALRLAAATFPHLADELRSIDRDADKAEALLIACFGILERHGVRKSF